MNSYYNHSNNNIRNESFIQMSTLYKERMKRDIKPSLDSRVGNLEKIMDQGIKEMGEMKEEMGEMKERIEKLEKQLRER